ncbi:ANKRD17 [Symbiodinium sp. CCMP2592]|nr:ANKRD17 [Symbiodinium sp. CCMP2592]
MAYHEGSQVQRHAFPAEGEDMDLDSGDEDMEEPWEDEWRFEDDSRLIRVHRVLRRKLIRGRRRTRMLLQDGTRREHEDDWRQASWHHRRIDMDFLWTGETEFLVEQGGGPAQEAPPSQQAQESRDDRVHLDISAMPYDSAVYEDEAQGYSPSLPVGSPSSADPFPELFDDYPGQEATAQETPPEPQQAQESRDDRVFRRRRQRTRQLQRGFWTEVEHEDTKALLNGTVITFSRARLQPGSRSTSTPTWEQPGKHRKLEKPTSPWYWLQRKRDASIKKPQPHAGPHDVPLRRSYLLLEDGTCLNTGCEMWTNLSPAAQVRPLVAQGRRIYVALFGKPPGDGGDETPRGPEAGGREAERKRQWDNLPRELKLAIQRACRLFQCPECLRLKAPKKQRPSKLPIADEFNVAIGIDVFQEKDSQGDQWSFLNVLCQGTTFQVVAVLPDTHANPTAAVVLETFLTQWVNWAGYPERGVMTDRAKYFMAEFAEDIADSGCYLDSAAKASPWQLGQIERHGDTWKNAFRKLVWAQQVAGREEVQLATAATTQAKNDLSRKSGFSPGQWVLGRSIRLPANLADDGEVARIGAQAMAETPNTKFYRKSQLRFSAREVFVKASSDASLRRAELRKVRPSRGPFNVGDYVFYYDASSKEPGPNCWRGVGRIVGKEGGTRYSEDEVQSWTAIGNETELMVKDLLFPNLGCTGGFTGATTFTSRGRRMELGFPFFLQGAEEEASSDRGKTKLGDSRAEGTTAVRVRGPCRSHRGRGPRPGGEPGLCISIPRSMTTTSPVVEDPEAEAAEREAKRLRTVEPGETASYAAETCCVYVAYESQAYLTHKARETYRKHESAYLAWGVSESEFLFGFRRNDFEHKYQAMAAGNALEEEGAIYGFAEAARMFWLALKEHLESDGWVESRLEPALFYLREQSELVGILVTHVDDIEGGVKDGWLDKAFQKSSVALDFATNHFRDFIFRQERRRQLTDGLTPQELETFQSVSGELGWITRQLRCDLAYENGVIQRCKGDPCVADLVRLKQYVGQARRGADFRQRYWADVDLRNCVIVHLADSGHANGTPAYKEETRYRSVGGYFILAANPEILEGKTARANILAYHSSQTKRVCRNTLAAEASHLAEAIEAGDWAIVLLEEALTWQVDLKGWPSVIEKRQRVYVTDARSVFDYLAKESTSTSSDKRMAIEGALLRETVRKPGAHVRWIDGLQNVSNVLTKHNAEKDTLREFLRTGMTTLVQTRENQKLKERKQAERQRRKVAKDKDGEAQADQRRQRRQEAAAEAENLLNDSGPEADYKEGVRFSRVQYSLSPFICVPADFSSWMQAGRSFTDYTLHASQRRDAGFPLQVHPNGNLIAAGSTYSSLDGYTNDGLTDALLMSFDSTGSDMDRFRALQVHPNGNLIAAGFTSSSLDGYTNAGSSDTLLMSVDSTGTWQWTVQRGSGDDVFEALQVHPNGNLIAAGYTSSSLDGYTNAGSSDALLMSFDSTGTWQWTVQRGSGDDVFEALQVHPNGNLIAAGYTSSSLDGSTNAGSSDALLMSFDGTGTWQWTVQRGPAPAGAREEPPHVQVFSENFLLHVGSAIKARIETVLEDGAAGSTCPAEVLGGPESGSDMDRFRALQVDWNGHLIAAGYTDSSLDGNTNAGSNDAFLMSCDSTGTWQWTVQRGSGDDGFYGLQVDPNNNLIAAGFTTSSLDGYTNAGLNDVFLMSFEVTATAGAAGDWQWTAQRGSGDDWFIIPCRQAAGAARVHLQPQFPARSSSSSGSKSLGQEEAALQVHPNGNLIVAGFTESSLDGYTNAGGRDAFIMSFDSTGAWQWTVQRGSGYDRFNALQVHPNGNLIVAGSTESSLDGYTNAGSEDALIMSFDSTGAWQWTVQRGSESDGFNELEAGSGGSEGVDWNGNLIAAGHTSSSLDGYTNAGSNDVFLMSFNSTGAWQWTVQRGGSRVHPNGNLIVAGSTYSSLDGYTNAGGRDAFIMSFDSTGSGYDLFLALQVDWNGNLIVAGDTSSSLDGYTNAGLYDVLLVSFNSTGAWQWTVQRGGSRVLPASLV